MKRPTKPHWILLLLLPIDMLIFPVLSFAGANIPGFYGGVGNLVPPAVNTLPQVQNIVQGVSGLEQVGDNRMVVHQDQKKAVVEWQSFDIGANAWVHFDQTQTEIDPETGEPIIVPQTNWSALNRIYDQNPSQIFGRLSADGEVYLINQNGMLFSPGAQVDVHGLVASSLNIATQDFTNDLMTFAAENYQQTDSYDASVVAVSNHGSIRTDDNGAVMLIGPTVENSGTIEAPLGKILLASGTAVKIEEKIEGTTVKLATETGGDSESAVNYESGRLEAELGYVGMYGRFVNQEGLIRAVTAVRKNGSIELQATNTVTLGEQSATESPISISDEVVHESFEFKGGDIRIDSEDLIDIKGSVTAPSGTISVNAGDRIYLDSASRIDVSGSWVTLPAESSVASSQLNSVELKDDQEQKDSILRGQTIYYNIVEGSGIGDVSGALTSEEKTALEFSTYGGIIDLSSDRGDVIARSGSILDFSGGGIVYDEGLIDTTVLVMGTGVYAIEAADPSMAYDAIIGPDNPLTTNSERFGISETHDGVCYTGSASAIGNFSSSYHAGDDAGLLNVDAPEVLLNATLDGSVIAGVYQIHDETEIDEYGYQLTSGTVRPSAGTLTIGDKLTDARYEDVDPIVRSLTITNDKWLLPDDFDAAGDDLADPFQGASILSTEVITGSGLADITVAVREGIVVDSDARVELDPTCSLSLFGRRIEHRGAIVIPDGKVDFELASNLTSVEGESEYISAADLGYERIFLAPNSLIDVSGQQVDLSQAALFNGAHSTLAHIAGGEVELIAGTVAGDGVLVNAGAAINASGGWRIDDSGSITGGNAGTIRIAGTHVLLEGDIYAHSLADATGGTLDLHAQQVTVAATAPASGLPEGFGSTAPLPENMTGNLIIGTDQIDRTGATTIELTSITDITVTDGVTLLPSALKLASPGLSTLDVNGETVNFNDNGAAETEAENDGYLRVDIDQIQDTAISVRAGKTLGGHYVLPDSIADLNLHATARIASGAELAAAPQGAIKISGPTIETAGRVSAPAGTIELSATSGSGIVNILTGANIQAAAFNPPDEQVTTTGLAIGYEPLAGGTIRIDANHLIMQSGAILDVSGSDPIDHLLLNPDGAYRKETIAGAPGAIDITYANEFIRDGLLSAHATADNMPGGALVVTQSNPNAPLELNARDMQAYLQSGFDDITIGSYDEIIFSDSMNVTVGRKLTLDAPVVSTADQSISLKAPWVVMSNSYWPGDNPPDRNVGTLNLSADWIDFYGDIVLSGFDSISINAGRDIRLNDYFYDELSGLPYQWRGGLETGADLVINADRVYPTTQSIFSIVTDGDVATLATVAAASEAPVYSGGGRLSLEAANIQHMGRWYAPMGQLSMDATAENGRLYLDSGSVLSVAGDASVNYGGLDDEAVVWMEIDKSSQFVTPNVEVEQAPETGISLAGDEVIMRDDAVVNISGGGELFGYRFLPGTEGSVDPLKQSGVYVIVPGMSTAGPGRAVYLAGNGLIEEGVYSLMPEAYAFLEEAIIIEDLGTTATSDGNASMTEEGYAVCIGQMVVAGTEMVSTPSHYYDVRPASEVLAEGNYTQKRMTVGDAGTLGVTADTTILNGTLNASAATGFSGGRLSLGSVHITASATGARLPEGFFWRSSIPEDLIDQLIIDAATISDSGLATVAVGDPNLTETVVFEAGSILEAANIAVSAKNSILVQAGSRLAAGGESEGRMSLQSTDGRVTIESDSGLYAATDLTVDTRDLDLSEDVTLGSDSLTLISDAIFIVGEEGRPANMEGLVIDGTRWNNMRSIDTIDLSSRSDIVFIDDVDLQTTGSLAFDSDAIVLDSGNVNVSAATIQLQNTSLAGEVFAAKRENAENTAGTIKFAADDVSILFGPMADLDAPSGNTNDLSVVGADEATILANNDVVLSGEGTLYAFGDIRIESAGLLTALAEQANTEGLTVIETADVNFTSESGTIYTQSNGNPSGTSTGYGGEITLQGVSIDHAGAIYNPSGNIHFIATGLEAEGGIHLRDGSLIDASGTEHAAAGTISLEAARGNVEMAAGAEMQVSAGIQGDAGSLSIVCPEGTAQLAGNFYGHANGGVAGDFSLDAGMIGAVGSIADRLASGGISGNIELRNRQGDIEVDASDNLTAASITLVADKGTVAVDGVLNVSGDSGGGYLEVAAGQDIVVGNGAKLLANADVVGDGGRIALASAGGMIHLEEGSMTHLSPKGADSTGGSLYLRALRSENTDADNTGINIRLDGEIDGASAVIAEGVGVYENSIVTDAYVDTLVAEAAVWSDNLAAVDPPALENIFTVIAGIEIRSTGELTVTENLDLSDYTDTLEYGALTLRSAGDLTIAADVIDARTDVSILRDNTAQNSWSMNLVAGADLDSSASLAVFASASAGTLTMREDVRVYTENAPIRFASAGNVNLEELASRDEPMTNSRMQYNIGSYGGDVTGAIGGNLTIANGGIQTAVGDVQLAVKGDLNLRRGSNFAGAIRTVGEAPNPVDNPDATPTFLLSSYWEYNNGGNITLNVGGDINGHPLPSDSWDASSYNGTYYHADYSGGGSNGIVSMGGGDITIRSTGAMTCAVGLFGEGDLTITAEGNLDGRFLISDGQASLITANNFGTLENFDDQPIEASDARIEVVAQGSIELGTVLNPTIANYVYASPTSWDLRYTETTSVKLSSVSGSVLLTGDTRFYETLGDQKARFRILPATLSIDAAESILFGNSFYLAPSETGNLTLTAGADIRSTANDSETQNRYTVALSDVDPASVYGTVEDGKTAYQRMINAYAHDASLLHKNDPDPTAIIANGDVRDLMFFIPKASTLIAGDDIADIFYHTQNVNLDDITVVAAGNDIYFSSGTGTTYQAGIEIGGPGIVAVSAGNLIDLGTTNGIQLVGNLYNQTLPTPDEEADEPPASLFVYSGLGLDLNSISETLVETVDLFEDTREQGQAYSEALAEGDPEAAQQILDDINAETIDPFFDGVARGEGNVDMVNSQIYTSGNAGDIYIMATGEINVGKSTFRTSGDQGDNSGIYTTAGGSINVFVEEDLNVNESRLMSFMGGDIAAWSQSGDINAGRGSKTAISVAEATVDRSGETPKIVFTPPAVGSGVRALTFDPDGLEGPEPEPEIGDIYLFAPKGQIDAGEAGIAGKNIVLAATKVVNVQNIEVSGTSVGVPDTGMAATSIGALVGSGTVSETSKVAEEQAGLGGAKERFSKYVEDLAENLVPKWIAVEVVGFGEDEEEEEK